ncbi:MAG: ACP S-malonyltransferase [Boseongicola sp.]|nr:ACP S-malonyltransferase [Boseongicola sp.]MYH57282.1 ACP S-malonyltransferase [Boseongicola sp. SB0675_bin_26]
MKTAVLVCPGRGTYNKAELGYLRQHFPDPILLAEFDAVRISAGQDTVTALDSAARFSASRFGRGDNASALIYAATLGDFLSIDQSKIKIVAVTGNSMGWYSALSCAGAMTPLAGFELANTMGTLMQEALIGGQLIYPFAGNDWRPNPERKAKLLALVSEIDAQPDHALALSIDLGGMLVLAGNEAGLKSFEEAVPRIQDRFPMRMDNHAAFHTKLQSRVAELARARIGATCFDHPQLPLIDGRGAIWWPGSSDARNLRDYTLGHQVTQSYNFTRAVIIAAREFAPDIFIVTGPGAIFGGAVAQSLILANWRGMGNKTDFRDLQARAPVLVSMGVKTQRPSVTDCE